jgi:hypothetical protein
MEGRSINSGLRSGNGSSNDVFLVCFDMRIVLHVLLIVFLIVGAFGNEVIIFILSCVKPFRLKENA